MTENPSETNTYALLIGNNGYRGNELKNAINDAAGIKQMFDKLSYKTELITDFVYKDIPNIKYSLEKSLEDNIEIGIFYFAGHAFEIDNVNYIAPVDCPFSTSDASNCSHYSMKLDDIIKIFDRSNCRCKIIILDSCRDNPFKGCRDVKACSLTPIKVTKGYIIAYSTLPGEMSYDICPDSENHGVYAESFISHLNDKHLSVENFFKKVRETVYSLTEGKQISWEHTSLIGDFRFNKIGIYYIDFPYDEEAIENFKYKSNDTLFDEIIDGLRSYDFRTQNDAIRKFKDGITADINQQFILGRNILQADRGSFGVSDFIEDLDNNINSYNTQQGDNHILNGILYEIYFNSRGEYRTFDNVTRPLNIDKIFLLQYNPIYNKSFLLISALLFNYQNDLYYLPDGRIKSIYVTINYETKKGKRLYGNQQYNNIINKISIGAKDITDKIRKSYCINDYSKANLTWAISTYVLAYSSDIVFSSEIPDEHFYLSTP